MIHSFSPCLALSLLVSLLGRPAAIMGQVTSDAIDEYLQETLATHEMPGLAVAVLREDQMIYEGYFGVAEPTFSVPADRQTLFRVYSTTKLLVAVAIFQLIESGAITLADRLDTHLSDLPKSWGAVQIKNLLTHSSGLPDYIRYDVGPETTEDDLLNVLRLEPLEFPTGERFRYNQTNYWLLARIIATTSGKSFEDFVIDGQLDGVHDGVAFSSDARDIIPHRTQQYRYEDGIWQLSFRLGNKIAHAGNGLAISLPRFVEWGQRLYRDELLGGAAGKEAMWREFEYGNPNDRFLLGWGVYPVKDVDSYGFTGGGISALRVFPDHDLTVIFLSNGVRYFSVHNRVVNRLAGMIVPALQDEQAIAEDQVIEWFLGEDTDSAIEQFRIWRNDNRGLSLESTLNALGYALARNDRLEDAIRVFQLNVAEYPEAWNVYDSLGEGYEMQGKMKLAVKYYRKSVAINPDNQHGIDKINLLTTNE